MNKKTKKTLTIITILISGIAASYYLYCISTPIISNSDYNITARHGGKPHYFTFKVVDDHDTPLSNIRIDMYDDSGGGGGSTHVNGHWQYSPASELLDLFINGKTVYFAIPLLVFFFAPTTGPSGKNITINIKDLNFFEVEDLSNENNIN